MWRVAGKMNKLTIGIIGISIVIIMGIVAFNQKMNYIETGLNNFCLDNNLGEFTDKNHIVDQTWQVECNNTVVTKHVFCNNWIICHDTDKWGNCIDKEVSGLKCVFV